MLTSTVATPEEDARGIYRGFKPQGALGRKGGFPNELDHYNILTIEPEHSQHPEVLRPHMQEIRNVMHRIRTELLSKILTLTAMILEVPEEAMMATHALEGCKTEYLRYVRPLRNNSLFCRHFVTDKFLR